MDTISPFSKAFVALRTSSERQYRRFLDYAVGLLLVEVVVIATLTLLGGNLQSTFRAIDVSLGRAPHYSTCGAVFADGYAAAAGDAYACFSPSHGGYNLP